MRVLIFVLFWLLLMSRASLYIDVFFFYIIANLHGSKKAQTSTFSGIHSSHGWLFQAVVVPLGKQRGEVRFAWAMSGGSVVASQ